MSTRAHLDAVFGDQTGWVFIGTGTDQYVTDSGKVEHGHWAEKTYRWPAQADELDAFITEQAEAGADVYFTPTLSDNPVRKKTKNPKHSRKPLPVRALWSDLDGNQDLDRLGVLCASGGCWLIASGSGDDNGHLYVPLVDPAPPDVAEDLLRRLAVWLGGDPAPTWHGSYLRPVGSKNWKRTALTGESPSDVRFEVEPCPAVWSISDLNDLLPAVEATQPTAEVPEAETVGTLEANLKGILAEAVTADTDRSKRTMAAVAACVRAGLSDGQVITAMRGHAPTVAKYDGRADIEVTRVLGKIRAQQLTGPTWQDTGADTPTGEQRPLVRKPGFYFKDKIGLLVVTLAEDVMANGPLAVGIDDIMWRYQGGVWTPDRYVVRTRSAQLLGERYRRSHGTNVEDVIRSRVRTISCDPVAEVINFRNGLYLWQADLLRDHDPDVLSTVQLGVDYDPDATCPEFDRFLSQVVPEDMVALMWEFIGYLLYSGNPLHKAAMLVGTGRNGKGTFLRVMVKLLGERNVTAVSLHDLVGTRFSTASLFGKTANIAGDIDGSYLESTATFKAITGEDQISAEHKGRDRFDFTPWAVPVFSANKIPPSVDVTVGYLSRWLVIPFPNDFTGREDRKLDSRLQTKAELAGIAAKALPALRRLLDRGEFDLPESGRQARDEFTRRVDQVHTWVDECCELDPGHPFEPRTWLYQQYKEWAVRDGHKAVKASEFYDRLDAVPGCSATRRHGGTRGYVGLKLTA